MMDGSTSRLDAAAPRQVGRYQVLAPIGAGGMASVYLARLSGLPRFERTVALKLLHPHLRADPELKASMLDEARVAALMHHPNVVAVLDAGDDEAGLYLVMEYVSGESLSALRRELKRRDETLPLPVAARIVDDLLAGLHFAHDLCSEGGVHLGIVHRDVSPQNVLVGVDGISRLLDFGVAKSIGRDTRTRTGTIKGKVAYMAPEHLSGGALDRRADVWAAGVVAWEIFAGQRLYPAGLDEIALAMRILQQPPPRLRDVRPELPAALDEAVHAALEMNVADRCPTAAELRRRIANALAGDTAASAQEVGDLVNRLFGDTLRERTRRAGAELDPDAIGTTRLDGADFGDAIDVTVTAGEAAPPASRRRARIALGVALAAAALGAVAAGASARSSDTRGDPVASDPAPQAAPALPVTNGPGPAAVVLLPSAPSGAVAIAASKSAGVTPASRPPARKTARPVGQSAPELTRNPYAGNK